MTEEEEVANNNDNVAKGGKPAAAAKSEEARPRRARSTRRGRRHARGGSGPCDLDPPRVSLSLTSRLATRPTCVRNAITCLDLLLGLLQRHGVIRE